MTMMMRGHHAVASVLTCVLVVAACDAKPPAGPTPPGSDTIAVRFTEVASGLGSVVDLTSPLGDPRLFVVEQVGRIRVIRSGQLVTTPFLDITAKVGAGGERGLLGLAFHPQYANNRQFFVSYTDRQGHSIIERYVASSDADRADVNSGELILRVEQPFSNHNGGQIAFGPDGMFYIGLGDGGSGGDPLGHGQNPNTLLGALLRIDVSGALPYGIPAGNPYISGGGRPEIWAIGLRNPWRFSFDAQDGLIYIADVGQNRREEINVQRAATAGLNYGWNRMEGSSCYPAGTQCSSAGLVLPTLEYENPAQGCSVTGGYVYRGQRIPALRGYYLYADYCQGWIRAFRYGSDGRPGGERELGRGLGNITSFGRDATGELYVLTPTGRVYRIDPAQDATRDGAILAPATASVHVLKRSNQ
jgi:glucose/arabinose dehydrogenase